MEREAFTKVMRDVFELAPEQLRDRIRSIAALCHCLATTIYCTYRQHTLPIGIAQHTSIALKGCSQPSPPAAR